MPDESSVRPCDTEMSNTERVRRREGVILSHIMGYTYVRVL